jgi:hypothetical protein
MQPERIYCPKCDGEVRTLVSPAPDHSTHASVGGGELICVDMGEGCLHSNCPLSSVSGTVMAVRLARSGLGDDRFEKITAHCEHCTETAELKVVDRHLAVCSACGKTNRWVRLRADGGYIILTGVEVAD